ncbi:dyslexia-associated protein KIAA0319-like protein isoform X2 [Periplaneta americana]|uniref:dyslexia-associated protein KIAA0319-like protein isoform X2 n=1 Tax=Periplaneta americana TaxID=6978 RepID=UPI0037E7B99B
METAYLLATGNTIWSGVVTGEAAPGTSMSLACQDIQGNHLLGGVRDRGCQGKTVCLHKMYSESDLGGGADVYVQEVTSSRPIKQLVVSAISKEVRLPENEVTLLAFTVPAEQPGEHYKYEWTLLSQPEGVNSGTMNDQNGETLKLSHLIEGLYVFKVSVFAPGAYGETYANVTVLPHHPKGYRNGGGNR